MVFVNGPELAFGKVECVVGTADAASEAVLPFDVMADLKSAQETLAKLVADTRLCWSNGCPG